MFLAFCVFSFHSEIGDEIAGHYHLGLEGTSLVTQGYCLNFLSVCREHVVGARNKQAKTPEHREKLFEKIPKKKSALSLVFQKLCSR